MVKKIYCRLGVIFLIILSLILGLATIGTIAQAAGLVDDAVSASNLYSQYPLMNYTLDFYVDSSWTDILPWNWGAGIGKNVMYGIYCITNFLWIVSLYLSKATGYVVQQAYKLDFIDDMADTIGRNIQVLAGVNEHGFQSSGYYVGFLLLLVLILGIYVAYVGLLKRETSKAVQTLMNFVVIFIFSAAFIANAPSYIKKINEFSRDLSVTTLNLGAKIVAPDSQREDSVDIIRDCLFSVQVKQPWLLLQFGDTDESAIGKSRIERLLSTSPTENYGKDRGEIVKEEIEKNGNDNLTITEVVNRLGMVVFLFFFNIGISIFIFLLSGYMILTQVLFVVYAMLLPISFILALVPTYNGNVKKIIEKLFNTIMMRTGVTLIVTIAFSISIMFYNMSSEYPFFMIAFLQIVVFGGISIKINDLLSMFGLNGNDSLQVGRRFIRGPQMFIRRNFRRMERKVGRSIEKNIMSGKRHSSADRGNTQTSAETGNNSDRRNNEQERSRKATGDRKSDMQNRFRKEDEDTSGIKNRSENEGKNTVDSGKRSPELRPNVREKERQTESKSDTNTDKKTDVKQSGEKVHNTPKYEPRKKERENVTRLKQDIEENQISLQSDGKHKQSEYYQSAGTVRRENVNRKENQDRRQDNNQKEYRGLDSETFSHQKGRKNNRERRGHNK